MVNQLMMAIARAIKEEFPQCNIFTEKLEQGFESPCFFVWRKPRDSRVVPESLLAMRQTKKLLSIIIKVRSANCTKKSKGGH